MAATTWCRLRLLLNRICDVNIGQSKRLCSSTVEQHGKIERERKYPEYEVTKEGFKHVERLLPKELVPEPPQHSAYPTPSGWVPPADFAETPRYFVQRTRNHMLPVYLQTTHGGSRKLVMIRKVEGDIWAFEAELRKYLEEITEKKISTQVHEVGKFIRVKGLVQDMVADFLIEKGF